MKSIFLIFLIFTTMIYSSSKEKHNSSNLHLQNCKQYISDYFDHTDHMIGSMSDHSISMKEMYTKGMEDLTKLERDECYKFSKIKDDEIWDKVPNTKKELNDAYQRMKKNHPEASSLSATVSSYISSDGDEYTMKYNKHGAILTSINEKHFIENSVSGKMVSKRLKLYLGKDCDAFSEIYGKGSWGWSNSGFQISFQGKRFGFPRQEVNMEKCQF